MCGICGKINLDGKPIVEDEINLMNEALKHRGPDDEGIYINAQKNVGLGHRRLSVIDLSDAGHQPMSNEDNTVWMVFNGEIYNFQSLRVDLEKSGHKFKSKTDSEVIIHLWEKYGEKCLDYLRGMFSFAIWDERQQKLFLARDRFGQKPLKYYFNNKTFIFASELKAILKNLTVKPAVAVNSIYSFLSFNHIPSPATGFQDIFKLPAGHYAIFQNGQLSVNRYWHLDFSSKTTLSYQEAKEEIIKLLKEAVRLRLVADVPLGVFLSGGIDSAIVVALMSELTSSIKTFTIGFMEKSIDERRLAKIIAKKFATNHMELEIKPNAIEILPKLIYLYEEPYADSSALAIYYLAQLSRQFVKVALNGDGGDEAFGGYRRYYYWNLANIFGFDLYDKIVKHHYFNFVDIGNRFKKLDDVFAYGYKTSLPDDLLVKVDVATMAHSLEARSPFLDYKLAEFAASLPARWKINLFNKKKILKDAFKGVIPKEILVGKRYFSLPIDLWFQKELYQWARDIVLDKKSINRGYFKKSRLEKIFKEHKEGKRRHGQRIWALVCLELWHRQFIDL